MVVVVLEEVSMAWPRISSGLTLTKYSSLHLHITLFYSVHSMFRIAEDFIFSLVCLPQ